MLKSVEEAAGVFGRNTERSAVLHHAGPFSRVVFGFQVDLLRRPGRRRIHVLLFPVVKAAILGRHFHDSTIAEPVNPHSAAFPRTTIRRPAASIAAQQQGIAWWQCQCLVRSQMLLPNEREGL